MSQTLPNLVIDSLTENSSIGCDHIPDKIPIGTSDVQNNMISGLVTEELEHGILEGKGKDACRSPAELTVDTNSNKEVVLLTSSEPSNFKTSSKPKNSQVLVFSLTSTEEKLDMNTEDFISTQQVNLDQTDKFNEEQT
jgi:hypothetical protein